MPFSVPLCKPWFWWPSSLHKAKIWKLIQDIGHTGSYFLCAGAGFAQLGKEKGDVIAVFGYQRGGYREETDSFQRCTARRQEAMDTSHS